MNRQNLTYLFAFVFWVVCMFLPQGIWAQGQEQQKISPSKRPTISPSNYPSTDLLRRAQEALRSGELEATMAYARSVLELMARDREVAAAIARAASAQGTERASALEEANITIKTKSYPGARLAAPREAVVQEIVDVAPSGKFIEIKIQRCKKSPDGTETCWVVVIKL